MKRKMKSLHCRTKQEAVERARREVERSYGTKPGDRRWLVGSPPDSYEQERYRVEIHVLEGSPPKGYVLVLGWGSADGRVEGFNVHGDRVCRVNYL